MLYHWDEHHAETANTLTFDAVIANWALKPCPPVPCTLLLKVWGKPLVANPEENSCLNRFSACTAILARLRLKLSKWWMSHNKCWWVGWLSKWLHCSVQIVCVEELLMGRMLMSTPIKTCLLVSVRQRSAQTHRHIITHLNEDQPSGSMTVSIRGISYTTSSIFFHEDKRIISVTTK